VENEEVVEPECRADFERCPSDCDRVECIRCNPWAAWLAGRNPKIDWRGDMMLVTVYGEGHVVDASLDPSAESQKECRTTFVSAVNDKKEFRKGAAWSMVHVNAVETGLSTTNKQDQKLNADWQRLISKYQDVFPEEHPGIPPPRQVELKIELEEGAKPVSKPVYKLSPAEKDELKAQTELLLENGLICPSVSPWGAPVLLTPKKDGGLRTCLDYRAKQINGGGQMSHFPC
jgi:hypothetical protein